MNQCVDQRRIPGLSRLYADYLYQFGNLQPFYPAGSPWRPDALIEAAGRVDYASDRRALLAGILARQNQAFGGGEEVERNLERFARPGTVAVVTGQQVGLFGGPLLGLHKAMTAVCLARDLNARGIEAVPVFWLASQDHDLAEVNHAWVQDGESTPHRVETAIAPETPGQPVGPLRLGTETEAALDQFASITGASPEQMRELREAYRPDATLAEGFARLMNRWFAPWGLLLFDPMQAPETAAIAAPIYQSVVTRQDELSAAIGRRNQELEAAGYHVQVHQGAGSTMLFLHHRGAREGLRVLNGQYFCGDDAIDASEVRRILSESPELVSPSALLRPLVQDSLFPTVTQVTGPAETAYLAQSAVLYSALGLRQPIAWPRCSVTLLDPRSRRLLDKYDLALEDLWSEPAEELLARRVLPADLEQRVEEIRGELDRDFAELARRIEELDPTLVDATQTTGSKIKHQLDQLQGRVARSFLRRRDDLGRQARHLAGAIYPNRTLQERLLNSADWRIRYGDALLRQLYDHLTPTCPDHQVVEI